jgi:hypothetical protein
MDELGAPVLKVDIQGGGGPAHAGDDAVLAFLPDPDEELGLQKIDVVNHPSRFVRTSGHHGTGSRPLYPL